MDNETSEFLKRYNETEEKVKQYVLTPSDSIDDILEAINFCKTTILDENTQEEMEDIKNKYIIADEMKEFFKKINTIYSGLDVDTTKDQEIKFKNSYGNDWYLILKKPDSMKKIKKQYNLLRAKYLMQCQEMVSFCYNYGDMEYFDIKTEGGKEIDKKQLDKSCDEAMELLLEPLYLLYLFALTKLNEREKEEIRKQNTPSV
jgi:hypothetical protein